jgi:hypothetical protein
MMERDILPLRRSARRYPEYLRAEGIRFAVFPASAYQDKDPELARLIRFRVIYPTKKIARSLSGLMLARVAIYAPPGDWRDGPNYPSLTTKIAKPQKKPVTTRKSTTQPGKKKPRPVATTSSSKKRIKPPATRPAAMRPIPGKKKKPMPATTSTAPTAADTAPR